MSANGKVMSAKRVLVYRAGIATEIPQQLCCCGLERIARPRFAGARTKKLGHLAAPHHFHRSGQWLLFTLDNFCLECFLTMFVDHIQQIDTVLITGKIDIGLVVGCLPGLQQLSRGVV